MEEIKEEVQSSEIETEEEINVPSTPEYDEEFKKRTLALLRKVKAKNK